LRGKAPVGEGKNQWTAGFDDASDLLHDAHRSYQVLNRDADGCGLKLGVGKWQHWVGVQVVDEPRFEPRVSRQLLRVHAQANDSAVLDLGRQVTDPAAHEIQDRASRREVLPIDLGYGRDGVVVDVGHEARRLVEAQIQGFVVAAKRLRGYLGGVH